MYIIVKTENFVELFNKLDNSVQLRFNRLFELLKTNPYGIGKPIRTRWFRELKVNKFRVYYSIKDEKVSVLLLSVSDKKNQQETIDKIYSDLEEIMKNI